MLIQTLVDAKLIQPPKWLANNMAYLTIMGSEAYGCATDDSSDTDYYGFCIPPKNIIFKHLQGVIEGFGDQGQGFDQWQQHGVVFQDKVYDFQVFSIVKYFKLCADGNPNMIDSIYTPRSCMIHSATIGEMVRENRKLFLTKKCYHTYKGYSFAQMHKLGIKDPTGKRKETVDKYGFDLKFAYHIVRLLLQAEQILTHGDLDLMANSAVLKHIRQGGWTLAEIKNYFETKEKSLQELHDKSNLPHGPDIDRLKKLLLNCLEHHYGNLNSCITF